MSHQQLRAQAVQWMRDHYEEDTQLQDYIREAIEAYQAAMLSGNQLELMSLEAALELETEGAENILTQIQIRQEAIEHARVPLTKEDYFRLVSNDAFFASIAEIYAISCFSQHQVKIIRKIGNRLITDFDLPINPRSKRRFPCFT